MAIRLPQQGRLIALGRYRRRYIKRMCRKQDDISDKEVACRSHILKYYEEGFCLSLIFILLFFNKEIKDIQP